MASFVALSELQENLTDFLARAEAGEEIVVQREGKPAVRLVAERDPLIKDGKRVGGQNLLGVTYMAPDWDAPMTKEELAEWGL